MEWRRVYPRTALKLLGAVCGSCSLLMLSAFLFGPITLILGIMGVAISMGVFLGIFLDLILGTRKKYYTEIDLDTDDLIKLIGEADDKIGRIEDHKVRENKVFVRFRYFDYFDYRPKRSYMELPEASMGKGYRQYSTNNNLQFLIEKLFENKETRPSRSSIDTGRIEKEIEKLRREEVKRQMGASDQSYKRSPVNTYFNIFAIALPALGLIVGPLIIWMAGADIVSVLAYGLIGGAGGGFILWLLIMMIVIFKIGDMSMPLKYRLAPTALDLTNKEETRRWSVPYRKIETIKRINGTSMLYIVPNENWRIAGDLATLFMGKFLIKMPEEDIRFLREKYLHPPPHYRSPSHQEVIGMEWEEGPPQEEEEYYEVGDEDVEPFEERPIYYLKA